MGAMIGKGKRTQDVIDAVIRNGAVYFAAVGGAGALLSNVSQIRVLHMMIWDRSNSKASGRKLSGNRCHRQ